MSTPPPTSEFTLDGVYPWGRTLDEYVAMFALTPDDLRARILSCADGPASFNAELTARGTRVTSADPLYRFTADDIRRRVESTYDVMLSLVIRDAHRFVWKHVLTPQALGDLRLSAMRRFLADYDSGRAAGRYLDQSLPHLDFPDDSFDLAVSSHFLFLYSEQFDAPFHVAAIREMFRLAPDVRIFPLLDMTGATSPHLNTVIAELHSLGLVADMVPVNFEFQKGGDRMLRVRRQASAP
jgi:hypothetical protein